MPIALRVSGILREVEEAVRDLLPAHAFGVAFADGPDRVVVHVWHGRGGSGHVFAADEVPAPFRLPTPAAGRIDRVAPLDLGTAFGAAISAAPSSQLIVTGADPGDALFWILAEEAGPSGPDQVAGCRAMAHRVFRRIDDPEAVGDSLRRLEHVDMLDALVPDLDEVTDAAGALDRAAAILGRVLPNASVTASGVRDEATLAVLPPPVTAGQAWQYVVADDLSAHPDWSRLGREAGANHSMLRVPVRRPGRLLGTLTALSERPRQYAVLDLFLARRAAAHAAFAHSHAELAAERIDLRHQTHEATERAFRLEARVRELAGELDRRTGYRRAVGESPVWRQALMQATQVAGTNTTVLLLGESGTGKEVVARFLHRASERSNGPFVAINCAALPEQLLEAELFGYERGAFTGATQSKPGQLEQAAGGTLFLDEVAEMSPVSQAKFLRVLQEREFQRLGGTRTLTTDARIVAATNRDLEKAMARGQFREDLYYRLNVFSIPLPPLRARGDDILRLSEAFLSDIGRTVGRPPGGLSQEARAALIGYHWPGNVRELRNVLERAAILCDGGLITSEHLALRPARPQDAAVLLAMPDRSAASSTGGGPSHARPTADLASVERTLIEQALHDARFNKSRAAKTLGLTRAQLYVRLRRHGLE